LWTLSGNNIYYNNGNVGINNSTPQYTLDVDGSMNLLLTGGNIGPVLNISNLTNLPVPIGSSVSLQTNTGYAGNSVIYLNNYIYRNSTASADWDTSSARIQYKVGVDNKSYLEFNPINYANGVGLYASTGSGLSIDQNGNVYISGTASATSFNTTSDYRIKENIRLMTDSDYDIEKIRPVTYFNTLTQKDDIGLVAHELQNCLPFLVTGEKDGTDLQRVNYIGLIPILIKEVQNIKKEIQNIKNAL